jgi:hypothetical protein
MLKSHSIKFLLLAALVATLALSACSASGVPATGGVSIEVSATQTANSQTPVQVQPGETVQVRVSGFPPNQTVNLTMGLPNGVVGPALGTVRTDATGTATASFVVPTTLPNGQPLPTADLSLVIATADNAVKQVVNLLVASATK